MEHIPCTNVGYGLLEGLPQCREGKVPRITASTNT
jgi:hypothetical protein